MPPALMISVDGRPTNPKIGPHERLRGVCPWWDSIIAKQYVLTNQARAAYFRSSLEGRHSRDEVGGRDRATIGLDGEASG